MGFFISGEFSSSEPAPGSDRQKEKPMTQDTEPGTTKAVRNLTTSRTTKGTQSFTEILHNPLPKHPPFFMDVTLRDGNQALRKPWDLDQKETIFKQLLKLGVQGIEVGFASSNSQEFETCSRLSSIAPDNVVISSLSRAVEKEIGISWKAIRHASKPRIHIVYPISDFTIRNVLKLSPEKVLEKISESVSFAKSLVGSKGEVQFSGEHFGDSLENLDFAAEAFRTALNYGADIVNLPNTVERYRPWLFVSMVKAVANMLPENAKISVHTHNDLGMATATTVESYFSGAIQLETALNGLGERAGNTNTYEVAIALHNCGVDVPLNLSAIYETSRLVSYLSDIPIYEKAPLIGEDVISHRSGIHQDGVAKTRHLSKGAYRAFDATLIGRPEGDRIEFTNQSGRSAIFCILKDAGEDITLEQAEKLQPILKRISEDSGRGELTLNEIQLVWNQMKEIPRKTTSE
ncbi:LeuA family protein [Leptospira santarosai]|uniref:2-isopropylmalate synthase n=1 Tax=Leptospira santarosai serovar Shermani str. LT 821 TaxID=758847 RepID=K8Y2F4_9LEPT|nr:2-isopropylmalate synthase LeuA2 [Leptospira santarosai]EKT87788.1 2-isopropylmalate synthase [Leptospira santarosai serovar Shermani str. LT 821]EPG84427.1 HMGL-like protein [Leptospira santarosai serovar Shermani str. 1342KT]MDI7186158.1 LeuA family protein [Leptospira santarosai]MDI7188677.1 LeuA family protein [Leptospira santarosai]MDI7199888.1 LeuA family protein [Leptospira santarosai]